MISTPLQFNQIELHKKNKFVVTKKKKRLNISSFIYMYETCKYLHENYIKYDRANCKKI